MFLIVKLSILYEESEIKIHFNYEGINDVMYILQQYDFKISSQKYEQSCTITGSIPLSEVSELLNKLSGYKNVIQADHLLG